MSSFGKRQSFGLRPAERWNYVQPPAPVEQSHTIAERPLKFPVVTATLTLVLCALYAAQICLTGRPGEPFGFREAVTWGGISHHLVVDQQQWWRLFTAPWLHSSVDHLVGNVITLVVAGTLLERHIGAAWLAGVYFAGALGGSIGSIMLSDPQMVSVGASGAIMALVAMVYALSHHVALLTHAKRLRRLALFILIPALAPSAAHGVTQIDVGAHFGGLMVGLATAFLLLIIWDESKPMPGGRPAAASVAVIGVAFALFAGFAALVHAPAYLERLAALAPAAVLKDDTAISRDAFDLQQRYPHDPLLRLASAVQALHVRRYADAEYQARLGLAEHEILTDFFPRQLEYRLQGVLAVALLEQGQRDAAIEAAATACAAPDIGPALTKLKLCGGT